VRIPDLGVKTTDDRIQGRLHSGATGMTKTIEKDQGLGPGFGRPVAT
jgi:hypothetical protein